MSTDCSCSPWERSTRALQARLAFLHKRLGEPWPDRSDAHLLDTLGEWLVPMMEGRQDFQSLGSAGVTAALWSGLPWICRKQLDALAPADVCLPSGRTRHLDYMQVGNRCWQ